MVRETIQRAPPVLLGTCPGRGVQLPEGFFDSGFLRSKGRQVPLRPQEESHEKPSFKRVQYLVMFCGCLVAPVRDPMKSYFVRATH